MFPDHIRELAAKLLAEYGMAGRMVAAAESCTGGLIAGAVTDIPGSSEVFDRGFVTYTNVAKSEMLGDVGVGDEAAVEDLGGTGNVCDRAGDQATGAGLGGGDHAPGQAVLGQQLGRQIADVVREHGTPRLWSAHPIPEAAPSPPLARRCPRRGR